MRILAIETSCDETAVAILEIKNGCFNILASAISSQVKIHAKFGGIVPEVAARKQMEMIVPVLEQAISNFQFPISKNKKKYDFDYIAVTQGPGLITSLTVGVETAKTLAFALNKPLILVNHLAGHIYSAVLKSQQNNSQLLISNFQKLEKINYPALALVVSGGHTMLVVMKKENSYKIIGETLDDAVGEAYDKVAQILNLGYPGGPVIDRLALEGKENNFSLPRPMLKSENLNFSFSGLKTAVLYLVQDLKKKNKLNEETIKDICLEFQKATIDVLVEKTLLAIKKFKPKTFLLGGGVAASRALRTALSEKIKEHSPEIKVLIPEIKFTGDNAAMIALAGYLKIKRQKAKGKRRVITPPTPPLRKMSNNEDYKIKAEPNLKLK